MRIAVLDLGTNTFNLLIVDCHADGSISKVFNEKLAPKIGLGGINNKIITSDAFQRGIDSLIIQKQIIDSYKPDKVYVFGTSALRNALNSADFIKTVYDRTQLKIDVISGEREAELIFYGNRKAVNFGNHTVLILDIGGGSNEFIIANKETIFWKQSFEIGVSRLLQLFSPSDPFTLQNIIEMEQYIDSKLCDLYEALKQYNVDFLIGSSGAFDTFREMIVEEKGWQHTTDSSFEIDIQDFYRLKTKLVSLPQTDIKCIPGMDPMRVDMIGIAAVFVNFIVNKLELKRMVQSSYSLKEGVIDSLNHSD